MRDAITHVLMQSIPATDPTTVKVAEKVAQQEAQKILDNLPDALTADSATVDQYIENIENAWA